MLWPLPRGLKPSVASKCQRGGGRSGCPYCQEKREKAIPWLCSLVLCPILPTFHSEDPHLQWEKIPEKQLASPGKKRGATWFLLLTAKIQWGVPQLSLQPCLSCYLLCTQCLASQHRNEVIAFPWLLTFVPWNTHTAMYLLRITSVPDTVPGSETNKPDKSLMWSWNCENREKNK